MVPYCSSFMYSIPHTICMRICLLCFVSDKIIYCTTKPLAYVAPNPKNFLLSYCSCLCLIHWSQVLRREWRCRWSSVDRRLIYCINDDWDKWLNVRHTLDRIFMTGILYIQCYWRSLINDDNVINNEQTNEYFQAIMHPFKCIHHRLHSRIGIQNPVFWDLYKYNGTTTSSTQPRKTYHNNGKGWCLIIEL